MSAIVRPDKRLAAVPSVQRQPGASAVTAQTATVLIVDDEPSARLTLAAMMEPESCRIVFATGAAGLHERLERINPDVIICDVVMEDMCGDEFFRWLKAHERWHLVPIVAVTRLDSPVVRADLLEAGADSVLVKPCRPQELRAHVHAALRTRRAYARLGVEGCLGSGAIDPRHTTLGCG